MTEQPLYRLELTYTRDDYETYFWFYKWVLRKTQIRLVFYLLLSAVLGALCSYYMDNWIYFAVMVLVGILLDGYTIWSQNHIDKKVMERELKSMPVVYRFYPERMDVFSANGTQYGVKYSELYAVCEVETAYYIMIDKNTAAIIPKRSCSDDLKNFINGLASSQGRVIVRKSR